MNSRIGLLFAIAAVQIVLIAAFWFGGAGDSSEAGKLFDFEPDQVASVEVESSDSQVLLTRTESGWEVDGTPADAEKITSILDKLATLGAPWPVATSASSAERFEVGVDDFQRHVTLSGAEGTLAEFYLGTSPGFQRVHARTTGSDDVYSVELSNYELGVTADTWMDKGLLAWEQAPDAIEVSFANTDGRADSLRRTEEGWLFNGEAADQDKASGYANRFTTLQVLGPAAEDDATQAERLADIVTRESTEERAYRISRLGEDGDYLIAEGTQNYRVATYIAEQLLMKDMDFVPVVEEDTAGLDAGDPPVDEGSAADEVDAVPSGS